MSNLQQSGILIKIGDREQKSEKFTFREIVLEIKDGNYTHFANFQLSNDRCDLADNLTEGQAVTVHFSLRGRQWQDKYFNTLAAWKIVADTQQPNATPNAGSAPKAAGNGSQPVLADVEPPTSDDLPF